MRSSLILLAASFPMMAGFGALPFRFEENRGQIGSDVRYIARGNGYSLELTDSGNVLRLRDGGFRTRLVNARPGVRLEAFDRQPTRTSYLRGDSSEWVRDVPSYGKVRYRGVYDGVDVVFYGSGQRLEYDFVLAPGAHPRAIRFEIEGASSLSVEGGGDLVLASPRGAVRWKKPFAYQVENGVRREVQAEFRLLGNRRVGFRIGRFDPSRELVIDPVLTYATYLGGRSNDAARAIAVDSAGNVYIAGSTESSNLPFTAGSLQPAYGGGTDVYNVRGDAFIAKINPAGTQVLYNTYLGGRGDEVPMGIAVDSTGAVYVTGYTNSPNFPTTASALRRTFAGSGGNEFHKGGDAFAIKLNAAGNSLVYSTYLGGARDDVGTAITIDAAGNAYIAGATLSTDFPVSANAPQRTFKGTGGHPAFCAGCGPNIATGDGFVAKLNAAGSAITWATYLGGSLDDAPSSIALDPQGNVVVAGATLSSDFPTATPLQPAFQGASSSQDQVLVKLGDGFISKIAADGSRLMFSTYFGGSRDDVVTSIAIDAAGAIYAAGFTSSTNFPTTAGAYSRTFKGPASRTGRRTFLAGDAFAAKLNAAGSQLLYSTLLGGADDDGALAIALDPDGNAYLAGFTKSADFPLSTDALQRTIVANTEHGFLAKVNAAGSGIVYSSFFGGKASDYILGMTLDAAGSAYATGLTSSTDLPVSANAPQRTMTGLDDSNGPMGDAFVVKYSGMFTPKPVEPVEPVKPSVVLSTIVNGANLRGGPVAPGEIVALTGTGFGPEAAALGGFENPAGTLDTVVAQTRVLFDSVAAPLVSVFAGRVVAVVPYEVAGKPTTQVQIEYQGTRSAAVSAAVATSAPGLFSVSQDGKGQAVGFNEDGTPNSAEHPAAPGAVIALLGTGEGQTAPPGVNGLRTADAPPLPEQPVTVTINGEDAEVISAAGAPSLFAGYFQISVRVPATAVDGDLPVIVTVGAVPSQNELTVAVAGSGGVTETSRSSRSQRLPSRPAVSPQPRRAN